MKIKTLLRQHYTQLPLLLGSLLAVTLILFSTNIASAAAPTVTTGSASSITKTTATLNGNVTDAGGKPITQRGFQYGLTAEYGLNIIENLPELEETTLFAGYNGSGDGQFRFPQGITTDSSGNSYVADTNNNRIQKFDSNGNFITKWGSYGSGDGQFSNPLGITIDSSGYIYIADNYNNRIQKFDSNGNFITKWGSYGSGDGQFSSPVDVAVDLLGNVYITDFGNDRIQKFDSNGNFITKWGSQGSDDSQFNSPQGINTDNSGNVYVADSGNYRIQKFDSAGNYLYQFGSNGTGNGEFEWITSIYIDTHDNVYVADGHKIQLFNNVGEYISRWDIPNGRQNGEAVAINDFSRDGSGNSYILDFNNNRVQKFDSSNIYVTQWGWNSNANSQFYYLQGIDTDSIGNVYVADTGNNRIQKFDSNGNFLAKWGSQGTGDGQFQGPYGITSDISGNIYVADTGNNRIQKFDSNGNFITKWGSNGSDDGQFLYPRGITSDTFGNVYVADTDNNRIQKFDSNGNFITKWGSQGSDDSQFNSPQGINTDNSGNVYVADSGNYRIQKFDSAGNYLYQFGSNGTGEGEFNSLRDIDTDEQGNIYVVEDNRIQKFDSSGSLLSRWGTYGYLTDNLNLATGIAVDSVNNMVIADGNNHRVIKYAPILNEGSYFADISSLTCGTTYHYRAFATNANGTTVGDDATFTTSACPVLPTVETGDYEPYGSEGDRVNLFYTVLNDGGETGDSGVQYGPDTNYGNTVSGSNNGPNIVSQATIYSLTCDTTYHYRAYATNSAGTAYGEDKTFNLPCPLPYDLSLSGYRVTPKPVKAGQDVQYKLHITNNGPGTIPGNENGSFLYINIPASTQYIDVGATNGYEANCEDNGDISELVQQQGPFWAGYTGNLVVCGVYSSDEIDLAPGDSYNITIDLLATQDMQQGQDVLRTFASTNQEHRDPDFSILMQAIQSGSTLYAVPINNIINLTYGINDEQQSNSDSDPISDSVENASPNNGDGNNDGTPDSEQANVTSLPIPSGSNQGTYITLVTPSGTTITTTAIEQATSLATQDSSFDYPLGLISFTATDLSPGSTIPIELYYYTDQSPDSYIPRKYNPTTTAYTTLSTQTTTTLTQTTINTTKALKLTYQITDGGDLDQDNTTNGTIVDPVGLAQTKTTAPDTGLQTHWLLNIQ